ncbi:hypothetical protein GRI75_08625 [Altererythrobacter soli]|uniref:Uncharacterized protein n=1 Tax=Croceibacterium soli TaxID=1739690 RepID=A0A6I4UXJ8_9SPHN|nr:hypothetical protein [Croceibacterium soli]MXP41705.1 hypothetical protein [Croceibacterium soli]
MKHLITGVAAIALFAAAAQGQGNSQGKGNDVDHSKHAAGQSMKAAENKSDKPDKGNAAKADRGESGPKQAAMRGNEGNRGQGNAERKDVAKAASGQGKADRKDMAKADAGEKNRGNSASKADRGNDDRRVARRDDDARGIRVLDDGRRIFEAPRDRGEFAFLDAGRGLIDGCPPGLAKKNNGCLPPGQAKQGNRFADFDPDWWGLRGLGDGRYLYDDGHLLRLNGDRVAGFIPLLGGALALGNPWPSYYDPVPVPDYYVDYYDLGPSGGYRYADNVLYRVDPQTSVISSIAALLTGNPINVGAPMPAGYDVYNVPYPYRSQYADGPDAAYRYNDGYIYEVDPTTQLVRAAIELIAG